MLKRSDDDRDDPSIVPLESAERTRVENDRGSPTKSSAGGFAFRGGEFATRLCQLSSSSDARSSSFACSSNARATYALTLDERPSATAR